MPDTPGFMRQKYDDTALTLRTVHVGKRGISICHQVGRGHIDHSSWIHQGGFRGSLSLDSNCRVQRWRTLRKQGAAKTASMNISTANCVVCHKLVPSTGYLWTASVAPVARPGASTIVIPSGRRRETRQQSGQTNFHVVSLLFRSGPFSRTITLNVIRLASGESFIAVIICPVLAEPIPSDEG